MGSSANLTVMLSLVESEFAAHQGQTLICRSR